MGSRLQRFGQRELAGGDQVFVVRTVLDFIVQQVNKNGEQQKINECEQNQGGKNCVGLDYGG
jgi:hypothetical protein